MSLAFAAVLLSVSSPLHRGLAQTLPAALTADNPPDAANPARMETFQIPSHGSPLNALVYVAPGAGPHPVVVLLHGFPGNEKNLDLAQVIRRAGWDVLYFDYRGSWGSPGEFSFAHALEDTTAALAYLRDPGNATRLRADPRRIVLLGHSMGGWLAAYTAAHDAKIFGLGLISAADITAGLTLPVNATPEMRRQVQAKLAASLAAKGMAPLAGCTPDGLATELMAHATEWSLPGLGAKLAHIPTLIVTSDDGLAPAADALAAAMNDAGNSEVRSVHLATDHSYSGKRIELSVTILDALDYLPH